MKQIGIESEYIPDNVIPVTIDVKSLYTNIPISEGVDAFEAALNQRSNQSVPTSFLMKLLIMVLTLNVFVFNGIHYLQRVGTAMGSKVAPTFANLFMGMLETFILNNSAEFVNSIYKRTWLRYIDDIFLLWSGTEEELERFIVHINTLHPTIKFTTNYNFKERSVSFLDVNVTINKGKFITDLHKKDTQVCQYLLPSSCHPPHISKNIPYSLGYRLLRICSDKLTFEIRLAELKEMLVKRNYNPRSIDCAFEKLRSIERDLALEKVKKSCNNKITAVFPFDPRLPSIPSVINRHLDLMRSSDSHLNEVFKNGIQVAYKRSKNLREILCRAKLYPIQNRTSRSKNGWNICDKKCIICSHSKNLKAIKCTSNGELHDINQKITCKDNNVIYVIQCQKCVKRNQYVGKTAQTFERRMRSHRSSVMNSTDTPIGRHFSTNGHNTSHMQFFAVEKVYGDAFTLAQREQYWIQRLNSIHDGLNSNNAS